MKTTTAMRPMNRIPTNCGNTHLNGYSGGNATTNRTESATESPPRDFRMLNGDAD